MGELSYDCLLRKKNALKIRVNWKAVLGVFSYRRHVVCKDIF